MSNEKIAKILKKYQKTARTGKARAGFLAVFEKKMLYRTTKTENPSTTNKMVIKVLHKVSGKK
jgi:hypothetical protein